MIPAIGRANLLLRTGHSERRPWVSPFRRQTSAGFALIEFVGVLGVITILGALLIPKIFEAIRNGRLNQTAVEIQTTRTALAEHYAKFGSLASSNGAALMFSDELPGFDKILLTEGLIDKLFRTKLTTNAYIRGIAVSGFTDATGIDGTNGAYDLDGDGNNDVRGASYTIDAVLIGVSDEEAVALNNLIDGPALGADDTGNDTKGRVKYCKTAYTGSGNPGNGSGNNGNGTGQNGKGNGTGESNPGNGSDNNGNGSGGGGGNNGTENTPLRLQIHIAHR